MTGLSSLPITTGAVPLVLDAVALAALIWLAAGRRRYVVRWVPAAAVVAALLTGVIWFFSEKVWNLWGAPLPKRLYFYGGLAILALLLLVPKMVHLRRLSARIAAVPLAVVVVLASASLINQDFEYFPTLGSLFGDTGVKIVTLQQFHNVEPPATSGPPRPTVESDWEPPANMPDSGQVLRVNIPAPISQQTSALSFVYLPPAYLASPRANLPVLVLIHGIPGEAFDWLRGGRVAQFMDDYARAHKGLAPVVVIPDAGADSADYPPLCLNSDQGDSATFLAKDVPQWVKQTFGAGIFSPRQWAIGGYSYGGTCAMEMATNYPAAYPTFIDSSGEKEPTINQGREVLIHEYFDDDAEAFARQNALDVLKTRKYSGSAGIITVGADDPYYGAQASEVYQAMKRAGMDTQLQLAPGGHAWTAWKFGVENNMDWLMTRFGVLGTASGAAAR